MEVQLIRILQITKYYCQIVIDSTGNNFLVNGYIIVFVTTINEQLLSMFLRFHSIILTHVRKD